MVPNTGALKGLTLFITGASRGIGKAIALKAAKDGANIVIAAKTSTPHAKLPGTIFTAAAEIEAAGGRCLPCMTDIRDENQIAAAVAQAVDKFGGIDIVVNNASAISLTGTLETPMKKYDLMNGVNARGTYATSQACLPHLKKSRHPHILNISPPLNLNPRWFKNHVAYTMAKYGMSFCVLGMAEEFRDDGIAVNAIWPQTAIATAAMEMLAGDDAVKVCRKPEIMADAAYLILSQKPRALTGKFLIDEAVLSELGGIKNFDSYACVPGNKLLPDFFLDDADAKAAGESIKQLSNTDATHARNARSVLDEAPKAAAASAGPSDELVGRVSKLISADAVTKTQAVFLLDVTGVGKYLLDLKNGAGSIAKGDGNADVTMVVAPETLDEMLAGNLTPSAAFFKGKVKISGNMTLAMKLERVMLAANKSKL